MTVRGLRLAPRDTDLQFTHAMLLLDGERAGLAACGPELVASLPRFAASVRMNVAARLGARLHPLFADVVDLALADQLEPFDEVSPDLLAEVGQAMTVLAADRLVHLVPRLPDALELLAELAGDAVAANQEDAAVALFDRIVALPIPDDGDERGEHLRALNNACIQAHALKTYDAAVRIANRAQPVAHENPYIYHSAACAYAAVGDYAKALDQVRLAVEHGYDHLGKVENDRDLGPLLEWPEFKRLFREWHAREEGN
jgi:tetratricopeptide (TPR) repeat protein